MNLKLCIFPNDPIISYYNKGEIKKRYFNPENFFKEIHIISFTEKDIEEKQVESLAGTAKLKIHSVGKITNKNKTKILHEVMKIVENINPHIIRAYNPLIQGWIATKCAKKLKIPLLLSLHTQYDRMRDLTKKENLKRYLALKYSEKFVEPYVLKNANKITIVYRIIEPYVKKHTKTKPEIIYNKIDYEQFTNAKKINSFPKPLIISVGRLIEPKNHKCLIEAMKEINAHLLIVGNGPLYNELIKLRSKLNLENKVTIKQSIPHENLPDYYKSATVFSLAYDPSLEGLPIPIIEAMASGLPSVISFPKEGYSEGLEDTVLFSQRNAKDFAKNINSILEDENLRKNLSLKSSLKAKDFDNKILEKRESQIYSELLELSKTSIKEV